MKKEQQIVALEIDKGKNIIKHIIEKQHKEQHDLKEKKSEIKHNRT